MKTCLVISVAAAFLLQGCGSTKYIGYKNGQIDPTTLSGVMAQDDVEVLLSSHETVEGTIIASTGEELAVQMPDSVRKIAHRSIEKIVRGGVNGGAVFGGALIGGVAGALIGSASSSSSRNTWYPNKKMATVGGGCLGVLIGGVVGAVVTSGTTFLYSSGLRDTIEVQLDEVVVESTTYFIGKKEGREYRFARSEAVLRQSRFYPRVRGAREMFVRLGVPLPP